jgi:uncharacterized membrane protein (UPF0136 family)
MAWLKVVVGMFAILNIGGGIEGYISKGSVPSIISGCVAGVLLLVGLFLATNNTRLGFGICAVVAFGDLGFFTMKLTKGGGLWPAGVMVAASVVTLGALVAGHFMKPAGSASAVQKGE